MKARVVITVAKCNPPGPYTPPNLRDLEDLGDRYNEGKPQLSLAMEADQALINVTRVLEHGMEKYSRGNWKKGLEWVGITDSALRHLTAFLSGEDIDEESCLPHVDHLLCNALFLSQMYHTRKDLDNRTDNSERTIQHATE